MEKVIRYRFNIGQKFLPILFGHETGACIEQEAMCEIVNKSKDSIREWYGFMAQKNDEVIIKQTMSMKVLEVSSNKVVIVYPISAALIYWFYEMERKDNFYAFNFLVDSLYSFFNILPAITKEWHSNEN